MGLVMRRIAITGSLALGLLTVACTSNQEAPGEPAGAGADAVTPAKPEPTPESPPEPAPEPTAVIASVQMIQDCPAAHGAWRPPPVIQKAAENAVVADEPPAAMPPSMGAARRKSLGGSGPSQPCTQSTMQLVFATPGEGSTKVAVQQVRLLDPASGKALATLDAREPAAWADGAYQSWDETLGPRQEVKASYALSLPDWSAVERVLGSSYGVMFVLEVDVKLGDARQTLRSSEFPRERPHIVAT